MKASPSNPPVARLFRGEAQAALSQLRRDGETFAALVTDPPYSSGGIHIGSRQQSTTAKYLRSDTARTNQPFSGDHRDQLSHIAWSVLWLTAAADLLESGAPVLLFSDWRQLPASVVAMQAAGFTWRGIVPWLKPAARPNPGRFRQSAEFIVWGSKGPMPARPVYLRGHFQATAPTGARRIHQTQKPLELMMELLAIVPPGGHVLDPFAGSATTLLAAHMLGLPCTSIEQVPAIHATAEARLREVPTLAKSLQCPSVGMS